MSAILNSDARDSDEAMVLPSELPGWLVPAELERLNEGNRLARWESTCPPSDMVCSGVGSDVQLREVECHVRRLLISNQSSTRDEISVQSFNCLDTTTS